MKYNREGKLLRGVQGCLLIVIHHLSSICNNIIEDGCFAVAQQEIKAINNIMGLFSKQKLLRLAIPYAMYIALPDIFSELCVDAIFESYNDIQKFDHSNQYIFKQSVLRCVSFLISTERST